MRLIISGPPGAGKTTLICGVINQLRRRFSVAGLITLGEWENNVRSGYTLVNAANGSRRRFAETSDFPGAIKVGRYFVYPSALAFGLDALAYLAQSDVAVIDEVGRWELNGAGWFPVLERLSPDVKSKLEIWGVGEKNVDLVRSRWPREEEKVIDVTSSELNDLSFLKNFLPQ